MLDIIPLTEDTLDELEPLYRDFHKVAQSHYGWPQDAIDFEGIRRVIVIGMLHGYLIRDFQAERHIGFLFYQVEMYRSLEIKVLYMEEGAPVKIALDALFNRFLEDIKYLEHWDVISYPLLGSGQQRYTDYITWYGFKPVGQAVVKFHIFDGISVEIFQKQQFTPPPEGYRFISWDPQYEDGVVDVLAETFKESVDALWDPRFRSRAGMKEAFGFVQSGNYGVFWPSCTTILLNAEDKPVGVCLLNLVSPNEANIPLIGLLKSERQHKLGRSLLAQTIGKCIKEVLEEKIAIATVSATVATGNVPAIRMYRHTAFQEECWYPHVYQEKSQVLKRKANQWC